VLVLRSSNNGVVFGLSGGHADAQLWLFIVSVGALGGSVFLAGLVAMPELVGYPARIATRWNPVRLFGWAFALFVLGLLVTAIAGIWAAADLLGKTPFGQ